MPSKDKNSKLSLFRDYQRNAEKLKQINFDPRLFYLTPTIELVPLKLITGVYKILMSQPSSANANANGTPTPTFKPVYTLISHGLVSHTYSLLPECPSPKPPSVRPLAVYTTFKKHITHAEIADLSLYANQHANENTNENANDHSDETGNIQTNEQNSSAHDWELGEPSLIYLSFTKDTLDSDRTRGSLNELSLNFHATHKYSYSWRKMEWPLGSKCYSYFLHRQTELLNDIVVVAKTDIAPFQSPVDGSNLVKLSIDGSLVNPVLALLSWYALVSSHNYTIGQYIPKPCQSPKVLYDTVWADDPTMLLVPTSDDMKSDSDSEDTDFDDSESSVEIPAYKIKQIKVFDSSKLTQYSIPNEVLLHINHEAELWTKAHK